MADILSRGRWVKGTSQEVCTGLNSVGIFVNKIFISPMIQICVIGTGAIIQFWFVIMWSVSPNFLHPPSHFSGMASQTQIIGNWTVYSAAKLGQQKIYKRAVIKTPHCYLTLCEWNPPVTSGSKTSPCYWPFGRGIHQWPLDSPHKGQWKCPVMQKMMCKPCFRILRDKLWLFVSCSPWEH